MRRVVPAVLALLLLAPAALTGCTADEPDPPAVEHTAPTDEPALLQVRGNGFVAAGQPVALTGFNLYDAAATPAYACRPSTALTEQQLRNLFAQMRDRAGANVVRFWAYQTYTDAGRDLSAVDRVIRVARAEGMWVIPVLEDGPGDCTTDPAQTPKLRHDGDTYYLTGYTQAHGNTHLSLLEYARLMAEHYADEPTIAAWMIMNEAETHARTEDGRSALVPFAEHVGRTIKDADPNHLVTLGTQANGAPGASGPDFHDIYALAQMDFAEAHDWPHRHGGPEHALPGMWTDQQLPDPSAPQCQGSTAPLSCSFAFAERLGKPFVIGEAGIAAGGPAERAQRARYLDNKMRAAFDAGADGYLVWQANQENTDGYAVDPSAPDPLLERMRKLAADLRHS